MDGRAEHKSFVLTAEPEAPATAVATVRNAQFWCCAVWVLLWGLTLVEATEKVGLWLPLNCIVLDLYLWLRDGRSGKCWRRTSRAMKRWIRWSPVWMLVTTFFLGMLGTWLYQRV